MRKFCFSCGRKNDNLTEGLCKSCYDKSQTPQEKKAFISICRRCGLAKVGNVWKEIGIEKGAEIKKVTCENCVRKAMGYYEAILQLRGDFTDEILNFVGRQLEKENVLTRAEEKKEGIDFYIIRKSVAGKIAYQLKKRFKAKLKKTLKLYGKKLGKTISRLIISARI